VAGVERGDLVKAAGDSHLERCEDE
jgi:hypothetical protein